jgi:hypothetical protein
MFMAFLKPFTYLVRKDFAIAQLFFAVFSIPHKIKKLELPDKYSFP